MSLSSADKNSKLHSVFMKALQIVPIVFTLAVVIACLVFMIKNNISIKNLDNLAVYFTGSTLTVAALMIGFHFVKSVALVISPVFLYALAGMVFENFWVAVAVNFIGTFISLFLPYYLGKFMGMDAVNSLKKRFKSIEKLDSFTGQNAFSIVFICKVGAILPSDLNSLIFGAMNLPFMPYFISSNLSLFVLNILWTLLGAKGDLTNIWSYLYILPAFLMAIGVSVYMSFQAKKKMKKEAEEKADN